MFRVAGIGHRQDAILLHRGVGLQTRDEGELPPAGAVGGHVEDAFGMLDDDGFGCIA